MPFSFEGGQIAVLILQMENGALKMAILTCITNSQFPWMLSQWQHSLDWYLESVIVATKQVVIEEEARGAIVTFLNASNLLCSPQLSYKTAVYTLSIV